MIDTQRTLAYDQLFLCWRLPQDSAPAWHFSVEYRRRGVVPGGASRGGIRGGLAAARWGWQRLDEVSGTSAVIDRLEMDSVYVLRVRGCNKAGYGEYSEEVYLHTPPAPGEGTHLTRGKLDCSIHDKEHLPNIFGDFQIVVVCMVRNVMSPCMNMWQPSWLKVVHPSPEKGFKSPPLLFILKDNSVILYFMSFSFGHHF